MPNSSAFSDLRQLVAGRYPGVLCHAETAVRDDGQVDGRAFSCISGEQWRHHYLIISMGKNGEDGERIIIRFSAQRPEGHAPCENGGQKKDENSHICLLI